MFDAIKAAERKLTHSDEDDDEDDEVNCIETVQYHKSVSGRYGV